MVASVCALQPSGTGSVAFERSAKSVTARVTRGKLKEADHVFGVLLVDSATGRPLPLYYTRRTTVETNRVGEVLSVTVQFDEDEVSGAIRAYYMVDTYPAARGELASVVENRR